MSPYKPEFYYAMYCQVLILLSFQIHYNPNPVKRKESYIKQKQKEAEYEKKMKILEEEESRSSLKEYMVRRYENDAREKNQGGKNRSEKELQNVFELIECNSNPSLELIDTIDEVKKKIDNLYRKFELEIDNACEISRALNVREIDSAYLNLYIFQPFNIDFAKYSNRLHHVWHDERTKLLSPLKEIVENLGVAWDDSIFKSYCIRCNICKPTRSNKK